VTLPSQVFTLFIPKVANVRRQSAWHNDGEQEDFSLGDTQVLVVAGELLTGTLCKKTLGAAPGGLIHTVWEEAGPNATRGLLSQIQTLVNHWILQESFSIGIGDTIADNQTMEIINNTIQVAKNEVKALIKQAQDKQLEQQPGRTLQESFENRVNQVRAGCRSGFVCKGCGACTYESASSRGTNPVVQPPLRPLVWVS
jgi:DNA-directed RNA polymerase II subunit RPB1